VTNLVAELLDRGSGLDVNKSPDYWAVLDRVDIGFQNKGGRIGVTGPCLDVHGSWTNMRNAVNGNGVATVNVGAIIESE